MDSLTSLIAPIAPHLAEEIHHHAHGGGEDVAKWGSVFAKKWKPLVCNPRLFYYRVLTKCKGRSDAESALDVKSALAVRRRVMLLLEQARENKLVLFLFTSMVTHGVFRHLRNSLEAGVDLLLPSQGGPAWREFDLLRRERMSFSVLP